MEPLLYLCLSSVLFHLVSSQLAADDPVPDYQSQLEILKASFQVNLLLQQQDGGVLMEDRAPNWNGVFTPRQPVGNISQQCQDDFAQYESDLKQGKMYALQMLDATGKPPSGILQGNVNWLGSWSECLNISTDGFNVTFNARYYVIYLTPGQIKLPDVDVMRHGVCVPSSCSTFDVTAMMNSSIFYQFLFERRLVKAVSAQAIENPPLQKTTIAAIWQRAGFLLTLSLLLASFIATAVISLKYHLPPTTFDAEKIPHFHDYYDKPYCRIGPYLVGVAVGWLFFMTRGKIHKTKTMKRLIPVCWAVATASALAVVYGLYGTFHGTVLPDSVSALYLTVGRTVWGMAVGWVVIACYHGFGGVVDTILSWDFFVPLSRLTYSAYLVQQMVVLFYYQSRESLVHYTTLTMIYIFLGNLVISYGLAFLVSVAVESPLMGLQKLIFKK